jgi:hypothetical protein
VSWLEKVMPDRTAYTYAQYEREASELFGWEPVLVPGLCQTPAYTRIVLAGLGLSGEQAERQASSRQARRQLLNGPYPVPYEVVLGEAALRPDFIEPSLMADQLRLLLDLSRRRNVSLRVLRGSGRCHPGLCGAFAILDFERLPSIVFLEQFRASAYLYAAEQVADYRAAAKTLAALALSEQESCTFIGEVIAELGGANG